LGDLGDGGLGRTGHQPPDAIDLIGQEPREDAGLDIQPPSRETVEKFLALQS